MGKAIDAILSASLLQEGEKPPCAGWSKSCSRQGLTTAHRRLPQSEYRVPFISDEVENGFLRAGVRKKRHA